MADELDVELDGESESIKRIKGLSSKVKQTSEERDAALADKKKLEEDLAKERKEREFLVAFTDQAAKYPSAREHTEEIKTKVLAGYSVEDATVAVLAKSGKLKSADEMRKETVRNEALGGSAGTTVQNTAPKKPSEMNVAELRAALVEEEAKGNLGLT